MLKLSQFNDEDNLIGFEFRGDKIIDYETIDGILIYYTQNGKSYSESQISKILVGHYISKRLMDEGAVRATNLPISTYEELVKKNKKPPFYIRIILKIKSWIKIT